ncbi:hypothetical protein BJX99DRAFT_236461 [Aspergillus californicus]
MPWEFGEARFTGDMDVEMQEHPSHTQSRAETDREVPPSYQRLGDGMDLEMGLPPAYTPASWTNETPAISSNNEDGVSHGNKETGVFKKSIGNVRELLGCFSCRCFVKLIGKAFGIIMALAFCAYLVSLVVFAFIPSFNGKYGEG